MVPSKFINQIWTVPDWFDAKAISPPPPPKGVGSGSLVGVGSSVAVGALVGVCVAFWIIAPVPTLDFEVGDANPESKVWVTIKFCVLLAIKVWVGEIIGEAKPTQSGRLLLINKTTAIRIKIKPGRMIDRNDRGKYQGRDEF